MAHQAGLQQISTASDPRSYQEGYLEGWNKAWREYYESLSSGANVKVDACESVSNHSPVPIQTSVEENDSEPEIQEERTIESEDVPKYELSAEWAEFFKQSAALRLAEREREEFLAAKDENIEYIELGGLHDAEQQERAARLYGERANEVLRVETQLDAAYTSAAAERRAPFWPVLPLAQWKR